MIPLLQRFHVTIPVSDLIVWGLCRGSPLKYFRFSILLTGCLMFECRFHIILPPRAKFACLGSRISRPPSTIGRLTMSHLTRWNFLWFPFPPCHKKSRIRLAIWSIIIFRARRKDAWKIGNDESITFTSVSLPALVCHRPPQPLIFYFSLLRTSSHYTALFGPRVKRRPRYLIFSQLAKPVNPRSFAIH